jgi:hypothetical protein
MFDRSGKNVASQVTGDLMKPIEGREECVGGIESLVLDDVRYFFGFDYKSDVVLSPLFCDMAEMSRFASRHMLQADGACDEAYWHELVSDAIDDSELCSTPEERTFRSQLLEDFVSGLQQAAESNSAVPGLSIEGHLLYLLDAAGGWEAQNATQIDFEGSLAIVSGEEVLPVNSTIADHAHALLMAMRALIEAAPENWSTLFSVLRTA